MPIDEEAGVSVHARHLNGLLGDGHRLGELTKAGKAQAQPYPRSHRIPGRVAKPNVLPKGVGRLSESAELEEGLPQVMRRGEPERGSSISLASTRARRLAAMASSGMESVSFWPK